MFLPINKSQNGPHVLVVRLCLSAARLLWTLEHWRHVWTCERSRFNINRSLTGELANWLTFMCRIHQSLGLFFAWWTKWPSLSQMLLLVSCLCQCGFKHLVFGETKANRCTNFVTIFKIALKKSSSSLKSFWFWNFTRHTWCKFAWTASSSIHTWCVGGFTQCSGAAGPINIFLCVGHQESTWRLIVSILSHCYVTSFLSSYLLYHHHDIIK